MKQINPPHSEITVNNVVLYPVATIELEAVDGRYFHYHPDPKLHGSAISLFQVTREGDEYTVWGWRTSEYIKLNPAFCPPEVAAAIQWVRDGKGQPI